jgi:hypothetical protein
MGLLYGALRPVLGAGTSEWGWGCCGYWDERAACYLGGLGVLGLGRIVALYYCSSTLYQIFYLYYGSSILYQIAKKKLVPLFLKR